MECPGRGGQLVPSMMKWMPFLAHGQPPVQQFFWRAPVLSLSVQVRQLSAYYALLFFVRIHF